MEEQLYYKDALKLAQKDYRACVWEGKSPCLPVLDDFVSASNAANAVDLGIVQIPSELIVGTKTRGRTNAFSSNFMPILEDGTEFADKWKRLCNAHLTEGYFGTYSHLGNMGSPRLSRLYFERRESKDFIADYFLHHFCPEEN